jgi:hypothetical protein
MTPTTELPRPVEDADWEAITEIARKSFRHATSQCCNQTGKRSDGIEFHTVHAALDWAQAELSRREGKPAKCACSDLPVEALEKFRHHFTPASIRGTDTAMLEVSIDFNSYEYNAMRDLLLAITNGGNAATGGENE